MISEAELRASAARFGVSLDSVRRDYALSWILKGLYENTALRRTLVFKGGTALRKVYFPDYRFSQDLDFTMIEGLQDTEIAAHFEAIAEQLRDESGIAFLPGELGLEKTRDVLGEEAYETRLYLLRPGQQRGMLLAARIEMTRYERVLLSPARRPLHHPYPDANCFADLRIVVYQLEEILAEKLRALLLQRGYAAPRDLYDIWYLQRIVSFDLNQIRSLFQQKCEHKGLDWRSASLDRFAARQESFQGAWTASLASQLAVVPSFNVVFTEVATFLRGLLGQ